jgi:TonB family protein
MSAPPRTVVPASLVVLTHNDALTQTLRTLTAGHSIIAIRIESDLATQLMQTHAGVAILDSAVVTGPIGQLTEHLKAQFPDLVLIVAGGLGEQKSLAAQITAGTVYRFLRKPVSDQRVKLFVEAAWRRHGEEHAAGGDFAANTGVLPQGRASLPRAALLAGGFVLTALLILGGWLIGYKPSAPATSPPSAAVGKYEAPAPVHDAIFENLLARAGQALAAGALVAPPGANAAELYQQALQRNGSDPRAAAGIGKVIDELLSAAQEQLTAQHVETAQKLTDQARALKPDHVRVAFLTAQIGKERERALLSQAREAAANGNVEQAIAVLDGASRERRHSTLVVEARQELEQQKSDERISDYLAKANERLSSGAILEPAEDNARFFVESARALAPQDAQVRQAETQLAQRLVLEARKSLAGGTPDEAQHWIQAAADAGVSSEDIDDLNHEAQRVEATAKADGLARLVMLFNQRITEDRLVDPPNDSAKAYLLQLIQADANHPSTILARQTLAVRTLNEAKISVQTQDFAATKHWLDEARDVGADAASIAAVEQSMTTAQEDTKESKDSKPENQPVAATSLALTRYEPPVFPITARERGMTGWVDLQFTVGTDGSVSDLTITGAQPAGLFEQAAKDAVKNWRYRPIMRDGQAVAQLARLRLKFALNK